MARCGPFIAKANWACSEAARGSNSNWLENSGQVEAFNTTFSAKIVGQNLRIFKMVLLKYIPKGHFLRSEIKLKKIATQFFRKCIFPPKKCREVTLLRNMLP